MATKYTRESLTDYGAGLRRHRTRGLGAPWGRRSLDARSASRLIVALTPLVALVLFVSSHFLTEPDGEAPRFERSAGRVVRLEVRATDSGADEYLADIEVVTPGGAIARGTIAAPRALWRRFELGESVAAFHVPGPRPGLVDIHRIELDSQPAEPVAP